MTALCAGLCDGIKLMCNRDKQTKNSVASIMLFTDGQANQVTFFFFCLFYLFLSINVIILPKNINFLSILRRHILNL